MDKRILKKLLSGVRRYLKPFLLILSISMVICGVTLWLVRREAVRAAQKTSDYFLQSIDSELANLTAYSHDILNQKSAAELSVLSRNAASMEAIYRESVTLTNYIYNFCLANPLVEDVIFYYPNIDATVSRAGYLTAQKLCALDNPDTVISSNFFAGWFEKRFDQAHNGYFSVYNQDSGITDFYFFRSSPDNTPLERCNRLMLLKCDQKQVEKLMGQLAVLMNQEYAALVTSDGRTYAKVGTIDGEEPAAVMEKMRAAGNITGQGRSRIWKMDLYLVQSANEVENFVGILARILIGGIVFALLSGLGVLILQYSRLMKQVSPVFDKVGVPDGGQDIYSAISDRLNRFYEENLQNLKTIERQRLLLNDSCLRNLLYMKGRSLEEMFAYCTTYDINFENDMFSAFVIAVDPMQARIFEERIQQILFDFDSNECYVLWCRQENGDVFLCNYDNSPEGKKALMEFREILRVQVGGRQHGNGRGFSALDQAIEECRTIYKIATGKSIVPDNGINNPEMTRALLVAMREGRYQTVLALMPLLNEQIAGNRKNSNEMLCRRYAFLYELYHLPQFQTDSSVPDRIYGSLSSALWLKPLEEYLLSAQKKTSEKPAQKNVISQAAQIIGVEYANPNMSLNSLSERLGVSKSYLSRAFKEAYGENISHYLNKTRIEHSKELMRSGDSNLNTIALSVGFLSDMNYIRVFKKLENETPGTYRKRTVEEANQPEEPDPED